MNGEPPRIEIGFWMGGELQLSRTCEISRFGCVPNVGDIITDELHEYLGALRVRRRVFVPMTAERDIWWLICDPLPDDQEVESLLVFDKEMRDELKQLEEEARIEEEQEVALNIRRLTLQKSKRPSHKKLLSDDTAKANTKSDRRHKTTPPVPPKETLEKLDRSSRDPEYWTDERKELLRLERDARLAAMKPTTAGQ